MGLRGLADNEIYIDKLETRHHSSSRTANDLVGVTEKGFFFFFFFSKVGKTR